MRPAPAHRGGEICVWDICDALCASGPHVGDDLVEGPVVGEARRTAVGMEYPFLARAWIEWDDHTTGDREGVVGLDSTQLGHRRGCMGEV